MSTTKHTPGPWEAEVRTPIGITYVWQGGTENAIAKVYAGVIEDAEANARLIAAAPELLDALKDAADQLFRLALADAHRWTGDANRTKALEHANKVCAPARAVIAKATGNTI